MENNTTHMQKLPDFSDNTILVIDDNPANLAVIVNLLESCGAEAIIARDGSDGLKRAKAFHPDLILLDVMMPGVDGFETCTLLKAAEETQDIPVIFMTALAEAKEKMRGFEVGGVDYITKPINNGEVLARISTHLNIRQLTKNLQDKNQELLDTLQNLQTTQAQLIQAEKMAALGNLVAGVAHEINTPIGVGITEASFLNDKTVEICKLFDEQELTQSVFEKYLSINSQISGSILKNLQRAAELVSNFKLVAVDQKSENLVTFHIRQYIERTLLSLNSKLETKSPSIQIECEPDLELKSYPGVFSLIITNLVMNSLVHGFADAGDHTISFGIEVGEIDVIFRYSDNGAGMSPETLQKVFDPFFTTKRSQGATGLGMHIVYNLVTQKLKGEITCVSSPEEGTEFTIKMPINE